MYDIFEKFPDGSTLWRAAATGRFETLRRMQQLAEHSDNEFYSIDVQETDRRAVNPGRMKKLAGGIAVREM
jgi:hypothetical protein